MSDPTSEQRPKSAAELEAELAAARQRLAVSVDELVTRTQPKEIARRQKENARLALIDATRTQDGGWRVERLVAVGAAVVAVVVASVLLRRRHG